MIIETQYQGLTYSKIATERKHYPVSQGRQAAVAVVIPFFLWCIVTFFLYWPNISMRHYALTEHGKNMAKFALCMITQDNFVSPPTRNPVQSTSVNSQTISNQTNSHVLHVIKWSVRGPYVYDCRSGGGLRSTFSQTRRCSTGSAQFVKWKFLHVGRNPTDGLLTLELISWIMWILCTPRPIYRSTYRHRPTYRSSVGRCVECRSRCVGRHITEKSTEISADISTDTRPIFRLRVVVQQSADMSIDRPPTFHRYLTATCVLVTVTWVADII